MMAPTFITAGLEIALNRYLRLDPEILPYLAGLDGVVVAIEPEGIGLTLYLFPGPEGIRITDCYESKPTVHIRGTLPVLIRQWRGQPVNGEITIEGDSNAGRQFQTLLARLDIDWEEQISKVTGDALAHELGTFWRGLRQWGQHTSATLLRDCSEYLQQELRTLPPHPAVESFLSAVDILREDVDRLEARIIRLRRQLAGGNPI